MWSYFKWKCVVTFFIGRQRTCHTDPCVSYGNGVCLSVRPSVCLLHNCAWCQNDAGYGHTMFTVGFVKHLLPGSVKVFQKFERGHPDRGRWMRGVGKFVMYSQWVAVSQKRWEIGPRLRLITDRKSHKRFRLILKWTTLDDLELLLDAAGGDHYRIQTEGNHSRLYIQSVRMDDDAWYQCVAASVSGTATNRVRLQVIQGTSTTATTTSSSSLFGMHHQCVAPLVANSPHSGLSRAISIASS